MRRRGAWLVALCLLAGPVWGAASAFEQMLATATGLPPRQACEALARLQADPVAQGHASDVQAALAHALQRYQVDREATVPALLLRRRPLQLMVPRGMPSVRRVDPWPAGYVSPDGNLDLERQGDALELCTHEGVSLEPMPAPSSAMVRRSPLRFARLQRGESALYGTPAWAPNGLTVACSVQGQMCVASIDGRLQAVSEVPDLLGTKEGEEGLWDDHPFWSPDADALIYTRAVRDRQGRVLDPRVVWTNLHGTEVTISSGRAVGFVPTPGRPPRVLLLGGESLYLSDPHQADDEPHRIASGVRAATPSPDGRLVCVVHAGRLGFVPIGAGSEQTVHLPAEAGEVDQPPAWLSPVQVAVCCRQGEGVARTLSIWVCDRRDGEFRRLAPGFLEPWVQNGQQLATSQGLLQLEYPEKE